MKSFLSHAQVLTLALAFHLLPVGSEAQVPVTVNRSTVNSGGSVVLPTFSGSFSFNPQVQTPTMNFIGGSVSGTVGNNWASVSGSVSASPGGIPGNSASTVTITATPIVAIATNAPAVFTNSISASAIYSGGGIDRSTPSVSQSYAVTLIEDGGGGGGGSSAQSATILGQADGLESVSRKDSTTDLRKLLGFRITGSTNVTMTSVAFQLSNTSANGPNFLNLVLFKDLDGQEQWDIATDPIVATTTNAGGFAVFSGLNETFRTNTYFLAASFQPVNQSQNSFISASLKGQNVIVTFTNAPIQVTGGIFLGKQYAFLDTTTAEDNAAAAALAAQINSSVTSATNAQAAIFSSQLTGATNSQAALFNAQLAAATNGLGTSTTIVEGGVSTTSEKNDLMDAVIPAAAAGAAGIGAAFTSDALSKGSISSEFTPKP